MKKFDTFLFMNGIRKSEMAEYLGVSNSFITKLINESRSIPEDKLRKILENPDWDTSILTDKGGGGGGGLRSKPEGTDEYSYIPLLPFSAVAGFLTDNNREDAFGRSAVVFEDFSARGADCAIRVDGDSMYPRYSNGDILAVRIIKDPSFVQWGKVYVLSTTQGCVVKKLLPDPMAEDRIICHSENHEAYPDYSIPMSDVLAVGIVVGHAGVE